MPERATEKKVQIQDRDGKLIYNCLLFDGGEILRFASGWGFVTQEDIKENRWVIVDGWNATQETA